MDKLLINPGIEVEITDYINYETASLVDVLNWNIISLYEIWDTINEQNGKHEFKAILVDVCEDIPFNWN